MGTSQMLGEDIDSWETMMFLYNSALKEVGTKLEILNDEFVHIHKYNPIEYIKSRIKTPESIVKKLKRDGYESTIENMRNYINDIAGIRIVCSFTSDIYRLAEMIGKQNDLTVICVKDYIKNPKVSGYKSFHMHVTVPIFLSDRVVDTKVEIQIRTIAMDFWASLEHKIYYKFEGHAPEYISRDLRACAEIVSNLDAKMLQLNEAILEEKEKEEYYKTVNIYKFSKHFSQDIYVPFLEAYCSALGENEYYEQVLRVITMLDTPGIKGMRLSGQKWYEIDDEQDLDIATTLFAPDDETRINLMHKRYGGFWRYPGLLDFCYLVNPYYPPKKLKDELRASFDTLLTEYPSGMGVNSLLAAKNFGVHKDNIIVGNGAAELIKSLMESFSGKTGVIRPTFEEYPNRYAVEDEVVFTPSNDNYTYSVEELIEFYTCNKVDNIIIINPDNPSGNYLKKEEIIRLIKWTDSQGIKLVVDESFADFSDEPDNSLIEQKFIETYSRLYVMKSISKSYGVPGLRLGILVSSDTETIAAMKKDVAIWNINSFGEYYLQIAEKYKKDYAAAMDKFRVERKRFYNELEQISGIRVIPSQANYFMIEITNGMTAKELMIKLFKNHYLLIKDLTSKVHDGKQYIRIAIRNDADNNKMLEALKKEFN